MVSPLAQDKGQFRQLIDSMPQMVWVSDLSRCCVFCNQQWQSYIGRSLEQELGLAWTDHLHPDDAGHATQSWTGAIESGAACAIECRLRRVDGKFRWFLVSCAPWFESQGQMCGYTASMVDITDRKRGEEQLEQLRSRALQAQKMEAIGQLTGGIAHDFNNILASILGYAGLALTRYAPDKNGKLAEYLREIYQGGERARDLVAQMLAFSRGASGELMPCDLRPLVKEAGKLLAATLPSSIDLRLHMDEDVPPIATDAVQLHQIVLNLCINSRDAIDDQGRIEIALHQLRDVDLVCASCHGEISGDFVALAVTDTGCGIEPGLLPRVFDPFFSTKDIGKGSGMGLAVVHGFVHDCGGHIGLESTPGQGTSFRLLFPVAEAESRGAGGDAHGEVAPVTGSGDGAHILVVDDEESVARFVGDLLEGWGYRVTVLTDSSSALEWAEAHPDAAALAILDQTMPAMTGMDLAKVLRRITARLPVILCTGNSDRIDAMQLHEAGIDALLGKPYDPRLLHTTLKQLLSGETPGGQAGPSAGRPGVA
jgi:PAS domain S-box-containing protein